MYAGIQMTWSACDSLENSLSRVRNNLLNMLFPYEPIDVNINIKDSCLGMLVHAYIFLKETQET